MRNIKFVDVSEDLCETCYRAFKGGCPIWPTHKITKNCVEYRKRGHNSPTSKR